MPWFIFIYRNTNQPGSYIFYDALVLLGTLNQNQTEMPVRVVGYKIADVKYYVATDRNDLTAEQTATIYKLRWTIEDFFKWWKEHLKVYPSVAEVMRLLASRHQACSCSNLPQKLDNAEDEILMASPKGKTFSKIMFKSGSHIQ